MNDEQSTVYYVNGSFIIFEPSHALRLRRKRIVGHSIGVSDGNGPYCISDYAANIVWSHKLARFRRLVPFETVSLEDNKVKFAHRFAELLDKEKKEFTENRRNELQKRNIPETPKTMKQFDEHKMRLEITNLPDELIPTLDSLVMTDEELSSVLDTTTSKIGQLAVFRDLYSRGFFVGSGLKFGCDFLVYQGDPVRYHAQYAVRLVDSKDGSVDLKGESFNELNAFQRLTHCANKVPVFATFHNDKVIYLTLDEREYLTSKSNSDTFKPMIPHLKGLHKHRRVD